MSDARRLDDCLSIRDGRLFVEGRAAGDLARVVRDAALCDVGGSAAPQRATAHRRVLDTLAGPRFVLLPSIKANSTLALRRILTDEGTGCDAFGPNELEAALRTGTDPGLISLNGPMKDEALLERAITLA